MGRLVTEHNSNIIFKILLSKILIYKDLLTRTSAPLVSITFYKLALRSLLLRLYKYLDNGLFSCFLFLVDSYVKLLIFNFCHTTATKIELDNFCVVKMFLIHNKY